MRISDWSSDVCSSDLLSPPGAHRMNSYYMRAIDKQEIIAIGVDLALLTIDESGQLLTTSADIVWDEIGTLYEPTGEIDAEGNPVLAPIVDGEGRIYRSEEHTSEIQSLMRISYAVL